MFYSFWSSCIPFLHLYEYDCLSLGFYCCWSLFHQVSYNECQRRKIVPFFLFNVLFWFSLVLLFLFLLVHRAELVENQGSKIISSSVIGPRRCVSNCRERERKAAEATKEMQRLNYIEEQVFTILFF
jgi:hypothetical protein